MCSGLGLFSGNFKMFRPSYDLEVPHMGWNRLTLSDQAIGMIYPYQHRPYVYFIHSYYLESTCLDMLASTTFYGRDFVSSIQTDHLLATQFHPEKSHQNGLRLLKNFVEL